MKELLTRDEMEELKKTDFEQYKTKISSDWDTQEADIIKLKSIMASVDMTQKKTLVLGDKNFPIWAIDAYEYFDAKYGSQYGSVIFEKILSKIWDEIPQTILME